MIRMMLACAAIVPGFASTAMGADAPAAAPERWKGSIAIPGQRIDFEVAFTLPVPGAGDAKPTAVMSIPLQGIKDNACQGVIYTDTEMAFTLTLPSPQSTWPSFTATRDPADGAKATGAIRQVGMEFPVTLERMKEGETTGPNRPQEPKAPFPYVTREVFAINAVDGTKLAGTMCIPEAAKFGTGPHPFVLLITGSGAQDRDEALLGHRPFLVIADHLARAGIGTLRVDDRGAGESTTGKPLDQCTTDDFVGDALACVEFLKQQPEVDAARIGLLGHSEGGLIAPMVAVKSPEVAFIVLLAGTGVNGREILLEQVPAGVAASGATPEQVERIRAAMVTLLDAVQADDEAGVKAATAALVEADPDMAAAPADMKSMAAEALASQFSSRWFKRFMAIEPREALRQVDVPVLALNGALDVQVSARQNLPRIAEALEEGGNDDVTIEELAGLNHLFQTATTGAGAEYAAIEETFAPAALEKISAWLRAKTGVE